MQRCSKRQFLRTLAVGIGVPYFVPASVLGANAPSKKITIGFIGTGSHGTGWNLTRYLELPQAQVLMVCDVDGARMRKAKAMVDAKYDNEDCAMSKDFRDVLARKYIDAVMISTPDHWHTLISVMAARAGKDVQCEKPTLTIDEGKFLVKLIREQQFSLWSYATKAGCCATCAVWRRELGVWAGEGLGMDRRVLGSAGRGVLEG